MTRPASRPASRDIPPGTVPDSGTLREAALRHLARFAATEAGLVRVLDRRVDRWARRSEAAGTDADAIAAAVATARRGVREIAAALVRDRILDDAAFAESRARALNRGGRSRRAIGAHLAQHGIAAELAEAALPERGEDADAAELAAALMQARRRRLGPFAPPVGEEDETGERRQKALAVLARAGFAREIAERALDLDPLEADERVNALRRS